jgi:hypothetical protein
MFLEQREQPYVLALSGKAHVWAGFYQHRVGTVLECLHRGELLPEEGFRRISAGEGSKGPRLYDWGRLPFNPSLQEGFERWLLVRRSIEDPEEISAYTVFAPEGATLEALAKAAGSRWRVEIGFEEAKGEVGLAHYELRSWDGWYRHITLSLFAHAFLASIRAEGVDIESSQRGVRNRRARTASGHSREGEDSSGADGLRSAQTPLVSFGLVPATSAAGRSALLVAVASSPSGRGQALPLQAERRASGMNYNCSTKQRVSS